MSDYCFLFSPTGGTKKVADALISGWGEPFETVDLMKPTEDRQIPNLNSDDVCLFCVPSYGGRVPGVAAERIAGLSGNGARAVLTAVFGNRAIDDTLLELSDLLQQAGFRPAAGIEAVAEHSLIRQFAAGRPDAEDIRELQAFAVQIRNSGSCGPVELPGGRPYRSYGGVPLKPAATGSCNGCGLCARECPTGAISVLDPRKTNPKKCISCMHCVAICPRNARKLNKVMVSVAAAKMKSACSERKPNRLYL